MRTFWRWDVLKHYVAQITTALVVSWGAWYLTKDWAPGLIHLGVCTYIIGPC
jgi:hypothetical protein